MKRFGLPFSDNPCASLQTPISPLPSTPSPVSVLPDKLISTTFPSINAPIKAPVISFLLNLMVVWLPDGSPTTCTPSHLEVIEGTAHDIKGQAGTFDFPLLTLIAESLCDMLRAADTIEDRQIGLIEAHIDAIGIIVRRRIQGDGGDMGKQLLSRLQTAVRKVST